MLQSTRRFAIVLVVLALVAAACGGSSSTPSGEASGGGAAKTGGTLRVAGDGGPDSMNPFNATAQSSYAFFREMYPYLVLYNETYDDFVGDLASDWDVSPDGKVWTFNIRPGLKWSDGEPLTAEDAAFMFEMGKMPGSGFTGTTKEVKSAIATDPETLVVTYNVPVGSVLPQLQTMYILPKHIWEPIAAKGVKAMKEYEEKAPFVSGGPWVMDQYQQDEFALFEKNPNWYGDDPMIDSWGVQFYEEDEAKIAALKGGEADLIWFLPASGVDPLEQAGFNIDTSPGVEFHDVIFNSNPKPIENELVKDQQLRLALEYSMNRERMIETSQLGLATSGSTIVPPVTGKWFNNSIDVVPYDPEKAKQILDDAGMVDSDGDGVRESPDGKPLDFTVMTQNGLPGVNSDFQVLKDEWGKIGVKVTQRPLSYNALWEANQAPIDDKTGIGEYLEFEIILWDWVPLQDPDFILSVLKCDQLSVWSDTAYCDKPYDEMYDQQGIEVDQKTRKDIVWKMQEQIYNERPYLVSYYLDSLFANDPKWEGFVPSPQGPINDLNRDTLLQVHQVG